VHGLDAAALAGAPSFPEVAPAVQRILSGGVFIAHGAGWDVRFLHAELHRMGIAPMVQFYIDTLHLSRRSFALPKYSLGALAEHFQWDRGTAHRAESDVRVLRELFRRCTESLSPVSVRDLWEVRAGQRQARAAVVEGCQRALASQEPLLLTYRPSRKPPEDMLFMVQGVRTDLDPPVVMGYQLPGRSRKELRADRILRVDPPSLEEDS
jgi:DNA polymerase-3 subunit epsilon